MATAKTTTLTFPSNRAGRKRCAWLRTPNTADIVIECKKPKRSDGLEQLKIYCHAEGAPIGVWTNGGETIILHRRDPNQFQARAKWSLSK